jgi:cell wall-associated NlpC family hydrolase
MGPSGIDCSGFTLLTYRQLFGLNLGRSTEDQLQQGMPVNREALRPGDLVFFKTGFFKKHVGIYLDKGLFVHASATKGVTVSTLKLAYWQKNFWTARRINNS